MFLINNSSASVPFTLENSSKMTKMAIFLMLQPYTVGFSGNYGTRYRSRRSEKFGNGRISTDSVDPCIYYRPSCMQIQLGNKVLARSANFSRASPDLPIRP